MKRLVSVLMISGIANLAHAWTDASVNYYQPIAAFEALKEADTNSSKNTDKALGHKVQNDFKVVTSVSDESYSNEDSYSSNYDDSKELQDIMLNDKLYASLLAANSGAQDHVSSAEFVMLIREMHRINHNLELILKQMSTPQEVRS